jgi:MOSC domain-containing protein YiiM
MVNASVLAISRSPTHSFSKPKVESIRLVADLGIEGDAHAGETVKHRSRVKADPTQANLRQVHLIHAELFDELAAKGFSVAPGEMGENITTRGIDLLALPVGTKLHMGASAVVELTGLRNPCIQIDRFQKGLMAAVLDRDSEGQLILKAGVMGIVLTGGEVRSGDAISVTMPAQPHRRLERV